jgi:hypothetical protein
MPHNRSESAFSFGFRAQRRTNSLQHFDPYFYDDEVHDEYLQILASERIVGYSYEGRIDGALFDR